jgi:hypothetical protein
MRRISIAFSVQGRTGRLVSILGLTLLLVLAFGAVTARGAIGWMVDDVPFNGEATFSSSGTFEFEFDVAGVKFINCKETGKGKIFAGKKVELESTLSGCEIKWSEKNCQVEPIKWNLATWKGEKPWFYQWPKGLEVEEVHTAGYPTMNTLMLIISKGAACPWFPSVYVNDPDVDLAKWGVKEPFLCSGGGVGLGYGTEAVNLTVSTGTCPPWGSNHVFVTGSSTWQLTGAHTGKKFTRGFLPAPQVTTLDASEVSAGKATLRGTVNPRASATTYYFKYGYGEACCTSVPIPAKSAGSGNSSVEVSHVIEGLASDTTYHYRIIAENSNGTTLGSEKSFTTPESLTIPSWLIVSTPEPSGAKSSSLLGASCYTSISNCAAVGSYTNSAGVLVTLAKESFGTNWSVLPTPNPSGATSSQLADVSCTNVCMAVGDSTSGSTVSTLAEQRGFGPWTITPTPNPVGSTISRLRGVACLSSKECTAVGYASSGSGGYSTLIEHWDGSNWAIVPSPNVEGVSQSYLNDVFCLSAGDCWAVGASQGGKPVAALAMHWNGTAWSINSPPGLANSLLDVACTSSSSCVAAAGGFLVARWNGSTWSQESLPAPEGAKAGVANGISCTSASACVLVGSYTTSAPYKVSPLAERWNGSTWSVQTTSYPPGEVEEPKFVGTACTSATACTAVGNYRSSAGTSWSLLEERH